MYRIRSLVLFDDNDDDDHHDDGSFLADENFGKG